MNQLAWNHRHRAHLSRGGSIRRVGRLTAALASASAACAVWMPSATASPAEQFVQDATGSVLDCGSTTYTITSGSITIVSHADTTPTGNTNFTETITLNHVVAVDAAGNVYTIRGTEWFGGTTNAPQGSFVETGTGQVQVVAMGSGTVDNIKVVGHTTFVNFKVTEFDFGTCVA